MARPIEAGSVNTIYRFAPHRERSASAL